MIGASLAAGAVIWSPVFGTEWGFCRNPVLTQFPVPPPSGTVEGWELDTQAPTHCAPRGLPCHPVC